MQNIWKKNPADLDILSILEAIHKCAAKIEIAYNLHNENLVTPTIFIWLTSNFAHKFLHTYVQVCKIWFVSDLVWASYGDPQVLAGQWFSYVIGGLLPPKMGPSTYYLRLEI